MSMISIAGIYPSTIADGEGFRVSVYGAGCSHECIGCHNPQTWDIDNGTLLSVHDVFNRLNIQAKNFLDGVTFSGGDPMYQAESFLELAKMIRTVPDKDIWCYTGYIFEDLIRNHDEKYELLRHVDVLVDGRYVHELRDLTLGFRGSSNQRVIDVQESLQQGTAVWYHWQGCDCNICNPISSRIVHTY